MPRGHHYRGLQDVVLHISGCKGKSGKRKCLVCCVCGVCEDRDGQSDNVSLHAYDRAHYEIRVIYLGNLIESPGSINTVRLYTESSGATTNEQCSQYRYTTNSVKPSKLIWHI